MPVVEPVPAALDANLGVMLTAARTTASAEMAANVAQVSQPERDVPVDLTVSAETHVSGRTPVDVSI